MEPADGWELENLENTSRTYILFMLLRLKLTILANTYSGNNR